MIGLLSLVLAAAVAPGPEIDMVMGDDMLRLVRGSGAIRLIYRNTSPLELTDLRLAVPHAEFGLSEVMRGLFPAGGSTVPVTTLP